jgi:hypothetical protein
VVPWATAARPQEVMARTRARNKRWMLGKHVTRAKEGITLHSPHTKNKKKGITRFMAAIVTSDGEASAYDVVKSHMKARKKEDESPFLRHADGNPLLYNNFGKKLKRRRGRNRRERDGGKRKTRLCHAGERIRSKRRKRKSSGGMGFQGFQPVRQVNEDSERYVQANAGACHGNPQVDEQRFTITTTNRVAYGRNSQWALTPKKTSP